MGPILSAILVLLRILVRGHSFFYQIVQIELIPIVAEMANDLTMRVLIPHFFQLSAAQAQQHLFGALLAAVALVGSRMSIQHLRLKA